MTARLGSIGFGVVLAAAAVPARGARADEVNCWGRWRLDVARPPADAEVYFSPGSWCRGAKLPRTFTVEARPGPGGRPIISGSPLRPTEVTRGTTECGFEFSGPASGRDYYELSIGVNASGTALEGKARGLAPNPSGPAPSGPDRIAAAVVSACRQADADALWNVMTPRLRSELENRARQVRRGAPSDLGRLYGYRGRSEGFRGLVYLRSTMKSGDSPTNPCWRMGEWKLSPAVATAGGYVVPVEHGDFAIGFTFTKNDRGWQLDQMSKWTRVPNP